VSSCSPDRPDSPHRAAAGTSTCLRTSLVSCCSFDRTPAGKGVPSPADLGDGLSLSSCKLVSVDRPFRGAGLEQTRQCDSFRLVRAVRAAASMPGDPLQGPNRSFDRHFSLSTRSWLPGGSCRLRMRSSSLPPAVAPSRRSCCRRSPRVARSTSRPSRRACVSLLWLRLVMVAVAAERQALQTAAQSVIRCCRSTLSSTCASSSSGSSCIGHEASRAGAAAGAATGGAGRGADCICICCCCCCCCCCRGG
jgi:hypothetical protein